MRVIICGAGQVGYNIASYLSRDNNDVTVIDHDPYALAGAVENLDINGILGHASRPDVLDSAGATEADMVIAVTQVDEVNMVACQVAHSLFNVPKKIARIRDRSYLEPACSNLFSRAHMPIDVIVSPEVEVAKAIAQRLSVPGTTNVVPMVDGKVMLCGVICEQDCPVVNTPLSQLRILFPDIRAKIIAILRGHETIIPGPDDQMLIGDEVYFVVDTQQIERTLSAFGHEEKRAGDIVIIGGGNIGRALVQEIELSFPRCMIKMIEQNEEAAQKLGEDLEDVIVLRGDGLNRTLMKEVGMDRADAMIAVTNDDEANILGALLAKQHGCERVISLVNSTIYDTLLAPMGIDATVSPRAITVSTIMQHVRRGRIKGVHNIRNGVAEVIEAEVSESSSVTNQPLSELNLPKEILIGLVVRNDDILIPEPDLIIKAGDRVVLLATQNETQKVEKLFSVDISLI